MARCARALNWATRSPADAARISGLATSAPSIRLLSGRDWNTPHHWPGIRGFARFRCASPPGMPAAHELVRLVFGEIAVGSRRVGTAEVGPEGAGAPGRRRPGGEGLPAMCRRISALRHGGARRRLPDLAAREQADRRRQDGRKGQAPAACRRRPRRRAVAAPGCRSPVEKAAGSRPTQAATQVIRTGRICSKAGLEQRRRARAARLRPAGCSS